MPVREVRFKWNAPQSRLILSKARYVNMEGAIRAGKTTPAVMKAITYACDHPGAWMLLARYTDDALKIQLKPRFYELCPPELLKSWNAEEQYQELFNGSRIYLRGLKSSDESRRYVKTAGLTLAYIYVDQPEEMPEDMHSYLVGRLSQKGYPHQMVYTPNPPEEDHWLARVFPDDEDKPDHEFIRTSVYDNVEGVGLEYIASLKAQYPPGSAQFRRFIEGRRGLSAVGDPVYKGYFDRTRHVRDAAVLSGVPLIRGWDFGHRHPAVSFWQFTPWGALRALAEVQGDNQFLEDFAPMVVQATQALFPGHETIWDCCDPAGAGLQASGMRRTAVDALAELGIYPRFVTNANDPPRRDYAIQTLGRYMARHTAQGPAFTVHPRCRILIDGFEAGYVWEAIKRTGSLFPNTRRPKKDGFYDHLQNTAEYVVLNFAGATPKDVRAAKQQARHDVDPYDARQRPGAAHPTRAGY